MKLCKKLVAGGLLLSICLLGLFTENFVEAKTKVNNKVDKIIDLKEDQKYQYDLDMDGDNDEFYYDVIVQDEAEYKATIKLYINDKLSLTKKVEGWDAFMQLCDLDTKDSYLDLYINARGASDVVTYSSFARYNGKSVSLLTGIQKNRANKDFSIYRFSLANVKGDGTFTILADTPVYSRAIGCYYCYMPYKVKGNKITSIPTNTYTFHKNSKSYNYKAKKAITVYKTTASKTVSFKVKKGAVLRFDKLYVTKSGTTYFRAINSNGKTGWIRGDLENLFKEIPAWS